MPEENKNIGGFSKMNILIVVPWDQEFGGVASVAGNLATYLEGKKNKVYFLHPGAQNILNKGTTKWGFEGYKLRLRVPIVKGHSVRSFIAFLLHFPLTLTQIIYLLLSRRVEIINVHYPSAEFFYFAICRRFLGIKLVTSIHGADFFPGGKPKEHYPKSIRFLLSLSDRIVAPSKAFLQDFMILFPYHKNKGYFIHNGISIDEMNSPQQKYERIDEKKYLLCIAAHNEKKGIDVLIQAFSQIVTHDSFIQLILVGDGPLRQQHEELAKSLGVRERISFLGERGRSDVVNLLHGCELLILPSRSEPFGIVITEAMACRKPVVATMVGGIPEIIANGKSGILVEPDNPDSLSKAICSILEDNTFKTQLAANGYARVCANFLWDHTGAKYETLFSKLLNAPNFNHRQYDSDTVN
jgi:glycosyltransferase involved in cell wall biosynthesis